MRVYLDVVVVLNFLVDFLLLVGANRLSGFPAGAGRAAVAAGLGGIYGGACLLPGFRFLGSSLWRLVSLGVMGGIAYGLRHSAIRRTVLFILLSMALGGIALGLGSGSFWALVLGGAGIWLMCTLGFRGKAGEGQYVPVQIRAGGKTVSLTALRDTGNTLTDPVTGQSVLVVGAEAASRLTGLTKEQLSTPVETLAAGTVPGLRLIPYRAVGQSSGMLLAMRMEQVKIGAWQGSSLVAFAPEGLEAGGNYQALTGGAV